LFVFDYITYIEEQPHQLRGTNNKTVKQFLFLLPKGNRFSVLKYNSKYYTTTK